MLETAPMIEECPVNMECEVSAIIDSLPTHDVFIGRIEETYCDEEYIVKGVLDFGRFNPILFVLSDAFYWRLEGKNRKNWDSQEKL